MKKLNKELKHTNMLGTCDHFFPSLETLISFSPGDDDEDAPMISGFSDDVPMVIA